MNSFKKGFTMVELIFIIVILGILATVAIPRLAATRDDAEVSVFARNFATLVTDIASYQTSQARYEKSITDMTQVDVVNTGDYKAELGIRNNACIEIIVYEEDDEANNIKAGMFEVRTKNSDNHLCKTAIAFPLVARFLKNGKYVFLGEKITF